MLHLLAGGRWRLTGKQGSARLRQSGQAASIRDFATTMLRGSRSRSGPYRVAAQQVGRTVVGDDLTLAVRVAGARSDRALPSVPVVVRAGSGSWREAGATDAAGRTTYSLEGLAAGPHEVTLRVRRVPETRLLLLKPRRQGASRDVLAGRKTVLSQGLQVVVTARPRVRVRASWIARNTPTRATLTLSDAYGSSPRPATAVLHGPFGSRQQASCQRKQLRVRHPTVTGNGTVDLPGVTLRRAGFYAWYVGVPGDDYNLHATTCAGIFRVKND